MSLLDTPRGEKREAPASSERLSDPKLQDLIPIVMVIVGGCEPCAENMVKRALQQGSSWHEIDKTLQTVASMQKLDCFAKQSARKSLLAWKNHWPLVTELYCRRRVTRGSNLPDGVNLLRPVSISREVSSC